MPSNAQNILNEEWSGSYNTGYWGGLSEGQVPNMIPDGSGFVWGYGGGIISNTIAINEAIQDEGLQVEGYSYVWRIKNANTNLYELQGGVDPFTITVDVYEADGTLYTSYVYDYTEFQGWTTYEGAETFPDQYLDPAFFGNLTVNAEGIDTGYWAGHWGPEFDTSSSSLTLTYSSNPCYDNPLYDPACSGYAEAMAFLILEEQELTLASIPEPVIQEQTYEEPITVQDTSIQNSQTNPTEQIEISTSERTSDYKEAKVDTIGIAINAAADDAAFILNNIVNGELGGISSALENNQTQTSMGMAGVQAQGQGSSSSNQNDSEERETQGQKLKRAAKERAAGLQQQIVEADEIDEQQAQQQEMLAMMNYVPGFDTYKTALAGGKYPDVAFYAPTTIPDSKDGARNNFAQQLLHQQMVDMQYEER